MGKQIRDQRLAEMKSQQSPNRTTWGHKTAATHAPAPPVAEPSKVVDTSESYLDYSYTQSPSFIQKTSVKRNYRSATQDHSEPRRIAPYNYEVVDKTINERKQASYNQHLLKSIEKKTMQPVRYDISLINENKRAQAKASEITDKINEASAQKMKRRQSPKEEPKQPGYTMKEQSKKY